MFCSCITLVHVTLTKMCVFFLNIDLAETKFVQFLSHCRQKKRGKEREIDQPDRFLYVMQYYLI